MRAKSFQSCPTLCDPMDCSSPGSLLCPWGSLDKDTEMGCHALLQGIFPTQASNPGVLRLLHWQVGSLSLAPPGKPVGCLSSVQSLRHVRLFASPWIAAHLVKFKFRKQQNISWEILLKKTTLHLKLKFIWLSYAVLATLGGKHQVAIIHHLT